METNIGKKVIIRGDRSGAEFGTLVAQNGREVTLHNVRRLWYWDGAASLSQLAKMVRQTLGTASLLSRLVVSRYSTQSRLFLAQTRQSSQ